MRLHQPSESYRDLCIRARAIFRKRPDDIERAALLLAQVFYSENHLDPVTRAHPGYYCAIHAILAWDRVIVNQIRPALAKRVRNLRLSYVPTVPPPLFEAPWFVEIKRGDDSDRLFGNTIALCGFQLSLGAPWLLIGWRKDGNHDFFTYASWPQSWGNDDLGIDEPEIMTASLENGRWIRSNAISPQESGGADWLSQAVQFAISLGELLAAEDAPVRVVEQRENLPPNGSKLQGKTNSASNLRWMIKHVYLDEPPRTHSRAAEKPLQQFDAVGRELTGVEVAAHLRRQRFGPGHAQVKRIYIDPYQAHRWTAPKIPLKVVVGTKRGEE